MNLLDSLKALLVADVDVFQSVGNRIFSEPKQAALLPLIKMQRIDSTPSQSLGGSDGCTRDTVQIMVTSKVSEKEADTIQTQIRLALQGSQNVESEGIFIQSIFLDESGGAVSLNIPPTDGSSVDSFQVSMDYFVHYNYDIPKPQIPE